MIDFNEWTLQYPSGNEADGMLSGPVNNDTKYFLYDEASKCMFFSLNANEKGKSPNGSAARVELCGMNNWALSSSKCFVYSASIVSSNIKDATFTVGQILQCCEIKDSPLCRIEIKNGEVIAVVKNFLKDGVNTSDGKIWKYFLGTVESGAEIFVKLKIVNKELQIYYNGDTVIRHLFPEDVSDSLRCYYKLGIYYQHTGDILTEVRVSECDVK